MKHLPIFCFCLLMISISCTAQDLSSFYQINGFKLPALKSGQYMLSLTPRYTSLPSDYSSSSSISSTSSNQTSASTNQNTNTLFRLASSALYGISDKTTISISLEAAPGQSTGDQNFYSEFSSSSFSGTSFSSSNYREDSFLSTMTLAHRVQPNIEISVIGTYAVYNEPASAALRQTSNNGTTTTISVGTGQSSAKYRTFDIQASIVILGN